MHAYSNQPNPCLSPAATGFLRRTHEQQANEVVLLPPMMGVAPLMGRRPLCHEGGAVRAPHPPLRLRRRVLLRKLGGANLLAFLSDWFCTSDSGNACMCVDANTCVDAIVLQRFEERRHCSAPIIALTWKATTVQVDFSGLFRAQELDDYEVRVSLPGLMAPPRPLRGVLLGGMFGASGSARHCSRSSALSSRSGGPLRSGTDPELTCVHQAACAVVAIRLIPQCH